MTGPLTILLIGSLLQGSNCNSYQVNLPQIVQVMTGSCVTVPCSFDVANSFQSALNNQCKAIWRSTATGNTAQLTDRNPLTGDLTNKNCTTTFSNMQTGDTKDYYFRLDCGNPNRYSFIPPNFPSVKIQVTDNFPSPTLTPSSLKIKEGKSVSLTCSAPAPCLPHPPTLIWTPKLGDIQETLQENQDKTKFKTSVMNFTASQLYNKQKISCIAVYKKQDGSSDAALTSSLIPDVLYSPKNVTISISPSGSVVENSNLTLTCNSDANPAEQNYTWYRDDGGQKTVIGAGKILNIKVTTDRKMFFCKAVNEIGNKPSNITHIDVLYSPKNVTVLVSPSGSVLENSNVTLTCNSDANPAKQNYTWYRDDGGQETVIGTGKILNITVSKNRKSFFCKAENYVGEQQSNITHIDFLYSPKNVTVSVSPSGSVVENSNVTLTCNSDANPAEQNYTWYRADGGQETVTGTGKILNIKVTTDRRMFFCKAVNEIGKTLSNITHIDVLYSPKNVTVSVSPSGSVVENSNVTLTCNSDANPAEQNYTWYRDDGGQEAVIGTGKILNIKVTTDRKMFFCNAVNEIGKKPSNITHIDVLYSPKNVTVSVSPSGSVVENSNVTLTCNSDANPAEQNYTWLEVKADQEIVTGTGNTLNTTVSTDRDIFFCKAQNDVGEGHSNLSHIDVLFPSRILSSSKCMKTSNQVSCFCETAGNPSPTTHWYLHGKPVNQSSKMVITHESLNNSYLRSNITIVEPQDTDLSTLQCFSSNSLGSASKGFCVSCLDNSNVNEWQILMPVFIGIGVAFLLTVCALLVAVWFQKTHYKPKNVTATSGQHGAKKQTKADNSQPSTGTDLSCNKPEEMSKSSADKRENVVYASLNWRENNKVKEEDIYVNLELSDGPCLNEKKCDNGGEHSVSNNEEKESMHAEDKTKIIRRESEVVYAQVKFQTKTPESE